MKKFTLLFFALILITAMHSSASHLRDQILLSARMNGAQEVPAVTTSAVGLAALNLNPTRDTLCVNMTVTGLSGAITGTHIHSGTAGTTGPVLFDLTSFLIGNSLSATITGADLTPALLSDYLQGNMYLNVHTAANPNGEIRGQIIQETDVQFIATLDGAQQTPPVPTAAFGIGTFALSKHSGKLIVRVVTDGLSGTIDAAHLHTGAIGTSGPVSIDLTAGISGNNITATVDPTPILADLMAGNIYINIHTAVNPNGEIRGQLLGDSYLSFDALFTGAQEVPAVTTTATGLANVKLNTTFDSLWYDIAITGLADPATGAHFHNGAPGVSGPVVYDISSSINGNRITGLATGTDVTPLVNDLLKGNLYLNIHNTTNPNGEIRGQVYRLLREGYSGAIGGDQQVPNVVSSAWGTLVASIDRNQSDLHYMSVADGITPNGVHFHNAPDGQNGPVIFDLTSQFMNGGVFGYWKSTDAIPFMLANSLMFRNDSIYINMHTSAYPNGEIRGQAERGFICVTIATGINQLEEKGYSLSLYPNPANENLSMNVESKNVQDVRIELNDITGKIIFSEEIKLTKGENNLTYSIDDLSQGVYFLSIKNSSGITVNKFVKQ